MITACIVLLYLSYAIPVICLLVRGRSSIKPGPFWLGPVGLFANIVLLIFDKAQTLDDLHYIEVDLLMRTGSSHF